MVDHEKKRLEKMFDTDDVISVGCSFVFLVNQDIVTKYSLLSKGFDETDFTSSLSEDFAEFLGVRTANNAERLEIRRQISEAGHEFYEGLGEVDEHLQYLAGGLMAANEDYVLNHNGERETNGTVDILQNGFTVIQKRMLGRVRDRLSFPDLTTDVLNIAGSRDAQPVLLCPICGFSYLHILSVGVYTGTTLTEISDAGTIVRSERHPSVYRGSVVRMAVYCEGCAQLMELQLKFHKGQIYIEITAIGTLPEEGPIPDLWRD